MPPRPKRALDPDPEPSGGQQLGPLWREWPLLVCLVLFSAGVAIAATSHWRRGAMLMGGAAVLAGLFRLVLPEQRVGLLAVRRRWFDIVVALLAGALMCVLAVLVPPSQLG